MTALLWIFGVIPIMVCAKRISFQALTLLREVASVAPSSCAVVRDFCVMAWAGRGPGGRLNVPLPLFNFDEFSFESHLPVLHFMSGVPWRERSWPPVNLAVSWFLSRLLPCQHQNCLPQVSYPVFEFKKLVPTMPCSSRNIRTVAE